MQQLFWWIHVAHHHEGFSDVQDKFQLSSISSGWGWDNISKESQKLLHFAPSIRSTVEGLFPSFSGYNWFSLKKSCKNFYGMTWEKVWILGELAWNDPYVLCYIQVSIIYHYFLRSPPFRVSISLASDFITLISIYDPHFSHFPSVCSDEIHLLNVHRLLLTLMISPFRH